MKKEQLNKNDVQFMKVNILEEISFLILLFSSEICSIEESSTLSDRKTTQSG
jgi:hypothetical protein